MTESTNHMWKSRWTFIMAATGSAVGLGNIWKFPYITGEYGGGAFVIIYLICILLIGIPVMTAEIMLGRAGRKDPIASVLALSKQSGANPAWALIGGIGVFAGLMIMMFYSVVAGWALDYVISTGSGSYTAADAATIETNFADLTGSFGSQVVAHSTFIALTALVLIGGVTNGIGRAVEILMPVLFVLLLVLLGYSWATGDFSAGLKFMFTWDASKITSDAILTAMGHAFFTLSLGMGSIMVYGSYMTSQASIGRTAITIGLFDTVIALVAGMAMFPLVFANNMEPSAGPGLMFVTLPIAFANMPYGSLFGTVFFLLVSIAALSSSISLLEPGIAWLERKGFKRRTATIALAAVAWVGGVCSIYSSDVFNALDYLTANVMLPLGGLLIAIFAGWIVSRDVIKEQMQFTPGLIATLWLWLLRVVAPAGVIIIFANSLELLS